MLPDTSEVENGIITISEVCNTGKYTALESFKDYLDTLEVKEVEEPSKNLEEAAKSHAIYHREDDIEGMMDLTKFGSFIEGAKWKEKQMTSDAMEISFETFDTINATLKYKLGKKIKLIIIKE